MPYSIGEASDEVAELARLAVVEPGGGLVEQQDRRCRRHRARDPDEPPPPVGKLAGEAVEIVLEPELADAAHRGRREDRSRRPDQVAQARRTACARPAPACRFSATETSSKSSSDWNERRTPARARRAGLQDRPAIGVPLRSTRPALGFVKPVRASTIVVFPAPFGPISPTTSRGVDAEAHIVDRDDGAEPDREVLDLEGRGRHGARCNVDEVFAGEACGEGAGAACRCLARR